VRTAAKVVLWVVAAVVMTFLMINIHELGHTVVARLAGDHGASYSLYKRYPSGQFDCIGCNAYNPRLLSFWGKFANSVAGVLATQIVAVISLVGLRFGRRRSTVWLWRLWIGILVVGDAVWQTIQALDGPIATQKKLTNVDFRDALWLLHRHEGYGVPLLEIVLSIVVLLYVLGMLWAVIRLPRKGRRSRVRSVTLLRP
jgi:hypothetical protein